MALTIEKNSNKGNVNITMNAIASIAGNAASECYGVVGMASKQTLREGIAELLKKENYNRGVFAKDTKNGIEVDMYIVVGYGLKMTEVVSEVQKKVKYVLQKTLDINFKAINVYVQGIKTL